MLLSHDDFEDFDDDLDAKGVSSSMRDLSVDQEAEAESKSSSTRSRRSKDKERPPSSAAGRKSRVSKKAMAPPSMAPTEGMMTPGNSSAFGGGDDDDDDDDDKKGSNNIAESKSSSEYGLSGTLPESTQSRARALAKQRELAMKRRQQAMTSGAMMRGAGSSNAPSAGNFTPGVAQFSAPRAIDDDPYGPFGGSRPQLRAAQQAIPGGESWRPGTSDSYVPGGGSLFGDNNRGGSNQRAIEETYDERMQQGSRGSTAPVASRGPPVGANSVYSEDAGRYERPLTSQPFNPQRQQGSPGGDDDRGAPAPREKAASPKQRGGGGYRDEEPPRRGGAPQDRDDPFDARSPVNSNARRPVAAADNNRASSSRYDDDNDDNNDRSSRGRGNNGRDYDDNNNGRGRFADGFDDRREDNPRRSRDGASSKSRGGGGYGDSDRRRGDYDDELRGGGRRDYEPEDRRRDYDDDRGDRRESRDRRGGRGSGDDAADSRRPRRRYEDDDEEDSKKKAPSRQRREQRDDDDDDDDYEEERRQPRGGRLKGGRQASRGSERDSREVVDDSATANQADNSRLATGAAAVATPATAFDISQLPLHDMRLFLTSPTNRKAGIVQCYIKRNRAGTNKLFPEYSVYMKDGDRFMMCSKKRPNNKTSNYLISMGENDLKRNSTNYIGKLRANFAGTEFQIFDAGLSADDTGNNGGDDNTRSELGSIIYTSNVLGSRGPRKMQVAIPKVDSVSDKPVRSLRGTDILTKMKAHDYPNIVHMINKPPRWNDQVGAYVLNFNGRVTMASVKNFQLVQPEEQDSILLQFGRVGKDEFTMDFQWPMSPFQAFAITLSSFDSKIACD